MEVRHDDASLDYIRQVTEGELAAKMEKALRDPHVTSVRVHKPGSTFTDSRSRRFRVNKDGTIARLGQQARKQKRRAQKKARKRNR